MNTVDTEENICAEVGKDGHMLDIRYSQEENKESVTDEESVERTTMTLSMSVEDKKNLKMLAVNKGKTVSGMLHEWIQEAMKK